MLRVVSCCCLVWLSSCATAARFHTSPEGAQVYVNGLYEGETPLAFHNEGGLPKRYHLQIYKEGYVPLDFYLDSRLSWVWGYVGFFTFVPYFWGWSLSDDHVFTLQPDYPLIFPHENDDPEADEESL